jgi:hypothetical protein
MGPTGPAGLQSPPYWDPFPANAPITNVIYVRTTGSDVTGDGSLGNPYRTFQRAIRDVPQFIQTGVIYTVDVTGIGVEVFPPGYQVPQIQSSSLAYTWYENPVGPFIWTTPLNIMAMPQPVAAIPLADTLLPAGSYAVTSDPDTFLGTLSLTGAPRASWAADALKGTMLIPTGGQSSIQAYATSVITGSTTTTITIANFGSEIDGDLQIAEPSATFQGSEIPPGQPFTGQTFWQGGSFQVIGANAIAFQGIKFTNADPNLWASAITLGGNDLPIMELCDAQGVCFIRNGLNAVIYNSVIRSAGKAFVAESTEILASNVLITDVQQWYLVTGSSSFETTVFDNCPAFGSSPNVSTNGALGQIGTELISCWFRNATGPQAAVWAYGVGNLSVEDTKIDNTVAGDGILVEGPAAPVQLKHVTGSGNAGVGVHVNDGGTARVFDSGTIITGTGGDMKIGTLVPRAWADFRANAPINNEYDLTTPFVAATSGAVQPAGEELTGAGTGGRSGSRLFQRAGI